MRAVVLAAVAAASIATQVSAQALPPATVARIDAAVQTALKETGVPAASSPVLAGPASW